MSKALSVTFNALNKEAQFTNEILGSGATRIGKVNYARKGIYFEAFTGLATGLERIGKLCVMLDYYIEHSGQFPNAEFIKRHLGHNLQLLYGKSVEIAEMRSIQLRFLSNLSDPIHQAILNTLTDFAMGDRYSNIDLLGGRQSSDPIASWYTKVDLPLFDRHVSDKKKQQIRENAKAIDSLISPITHVLHTTEDNQELTEVEEASFRTGVYEATARYRQLYVVQIIRYWAELLVALQYSAMEAGYQDIPYFSEVFGNFRNHDSYVRTRKTWDCL